MLAYGGGSVKKNGIYGEISGILRALGKRVVDFSGIMPNPTYAKVQEGAALARKEQVDTILRSAAARSSTAAKIIARRRKPKRTSEHGICHGTKLPADAIPSAPLSQLPAGAEMNGGAVITNEALSVKTGVLALRPALRCSILYTLSVPFIQVISGAFDTLSHAMETYLGQSDQDNVSDDVALAVMRNTVVNMRRLLNDKDDLQARGNLMWGILLWRKTAS